MSAKRRLVVIGNGMAGARFVEDVLARNGRSAFDIVVFGDEPHGNYNRILLSSVLAGAHRPDDIFLNPIGWYAANGVTLHAGSLVDRIDIEARIVHAANGVFEPYDVLVIATGSSALVPPIPGLRDADGRFRRGVFPFRTLDDCKGMLQYATESRVAAVIGGGLLGLEAAKGLLNRGLETHIVHLRSHLMEVQLDADAGAVLQRQLERMGLHVHLDKQTTAVTGDDDITGLTFKDGSSIACGMVVVAAGIRPNVELAKQAGLEVQRGIVVDDDLRCGNATDVYAIGECAQHRGEVYGLVAPAWEQAKVLAERLAAQNTSARYEGTRLATKLKVAGVDLAVMGVREPVEEEDEVVTYAEASRGVYKKLIVRGGRLAGAIVMGDGSVVPTLMQAFAEESPIDDNRASLLFPLVTYGSPTPARKDASEIPDSTQICDCNAVTKAEIVDAVLHGARSVSAVSERTRACTGCGSCRPEVERIVALACEGMNAPEVLARAPAFEPVLTAPLVPEEGKLTVSGNKIERLKDEKNGLEIVEEVPRLAQEGWQALGDDDKERLKWAGVFFRRQTPGHFMMRVRMSNGLTNAEQLRVVADISREFGPSFLDITTRQQMQLRGFGIEHVPEIWNRLERVGLVTLQTGMDNIRNVIGCPLAGLAPHETIDASAVVHEYTNTFLRNREFTNLPRKFNVAISGCREHCVHGETQDLSLTPASQEVNGRKVAGFNVAVGGKMGSGGYRVATPIDVFVEPDAAAALCAEITRIFRDHGARGARTKARLAFLIDAWGSARFRQELERRVGARLLPAGKDDRTTRSADHLGIVKQKQKGLNAIGLTVPVGRITSDQLDEVARLAELYGSGEVRVTTSQNLIVVNVPDAKLPAFVQEPILKTLRHDPPGVMRGLVSCTGIDYCHFALIETKSIAIVTAEQLATRLPAHKTISMHWSGCPAGCGNHAAADIGLMGKNIRRDGELVDAVDVFVGGKAGPDARPGIRILEDVPCDDLPRVLEQVIPYLSKKATSPAPVASAPVPVVSGFSRTSADNGSVRLQPDL